MVKNSAFVFIKPHAVTEKTKELVKSVFEKAEITITKEGEVTSEEIDKKMLVDKHYYSIASKATLLTPDKLNIPKDKFKEKFGLEWDEALKSGACLNAKDACDKFGIDSTALDSMWAEAKKSNNMVKFGGGFYCAKLEKDGTFYVFNGFFMSMRSKFVLEGKTIYYYIVEWESSKLAWKDFRGEVLGATDPATASAGSLRGTILKDWKDLGLESEPNTGDNGVHASASPFEGLAERMNWLGYRCERDPFGKMLLKTGVDPRMVKEWCRDPQVTFGPIPMTRSLFDTLEDTDADWCLALCSMIAGPKSKDPPEDYSKVIAKLKADLEVYKPLEKAVLAIQSYVGTPEPKARKGKKEEIVEPVKGSKGKGKGKKVAPVEDDDEPPPRKGKGKGKGGGSGGKGGSKGKGKRKD